MVAADNTSAPVQPKCCVCGEADATRMCSGCDYDHSDPDDTGVLLCGNEACFLRAHLTKKLQKLHHPQLVPIGAQQALRSLATTCPEHPDERLAAASAEGHPLLLCPRCVAKSPFDAEVLWEAGAADVAAQLAGAAEEAKKVLQQAEHDAAAAGDCPALAAAEELSAVLHKTADEFSARVRGAVAERTERAGALAAAHEQQVEAVRRVCAAADVVRESGTAAQQLEHARVVRREAAGLATFTEGVGAVRRHFVSTLINAAKATEVACVAAAKKAKNVGAQGRSSSLKEAERVAGSFAPDRTRQVGQASGALLVADDQQIKLKLKVKKSYASVAKGLWSTLQQKQVVASALTLDGQTLLSADAQQLWQWDVSNRAVCVAKHDFEGVQCIVPSPHDGTIFVGMQDGTFRQLSAAAKLLRTFRGHEHAVNAIAHSCDGTLFSAGHSVWRWDVAAGRKLRQFFEPGPGAISSVALSPDGRLLAAGYSAGGVQLWEVESGALSHRLGGGRGGVRVGFLADGALVSCTAEKLQLWDRADGRMLEETPGRFFPHGSKVHEVQENALTTLSPQ